MAGNDIGTELCVAVFRVQIDKINDLLAKGANVNATGDHRVPSVANEAPLWIAVHRAAREQSSDWKEFYDALSDFGVAKHDRTEARSAYFRIIETLISAGADLEQRCHGSTPLRGAVSYNDPELVATLLRHGSNPNAETFSPLSKLAKVQGKKRLPAYWNSVLHEAVMRNSLEVVRLLVEAGADLARTDHEGKTPLEIAREKHFDEIVACLEKAASDRGSMEPPK